MMKTLKCNLSTIMETIEVGKRQGGTNVKLVIQQGLCCKGQKIENTNVSNTL